MDKANGEFAKADEGQSRISIVYHKDLGVSGNSLCLLARLRVWSCPKYQHLNHETPFAAKSHHQTPARKPKWNNPKPDTSLDAEPRSYQSSSNFFGLELELGDGGTGGNFRPARPRWKPAGFGFPFLGFRVFFF